MAERAASVSGSDANIVASSGLFDRDWYVASHPEVGDAGADPVGHYCREGWRQGLQPNPYFQPAWYVRTYGTELGPDENPLLHYIRRGEQENAWPSPHFDPEWYREEYALGEHESPLRHYLLNRAGGTVRPLPLFDEPQPSPTVTFAAVLDLLDGGARERVIPDTVSREAFERVLRLFIPLISFDEAWYCTSNPDVAEALRSGQIASAHGHFVEHGFFEGRAPTPPGAV